MALSERIKRKHIDAAVKFLPPDGSRPIDYAIGGGGVLSPRLISIALAAGLIVLIAVMSIALHTFFVIGVVPIAAASFVLNQPRGLLLTDRGVALLRRSFLNSRPEGLIGLDGAPALGRPLQQQAGYSKVQVGPGFIWVKNADLQRLQRQ